MQNMLQVTNSREGERMYPLGMANVGEIGIIARVTGSPELIRHFQRLNLREGRTVVVVSEARGSMTGSEPDASKWIGLPQCMC